MKNLLTFVVLPIVIIGLSILIIMGIMKPVNFEKEQKIREGRTIERLMDIRALQVAYKSETGKFTASFDTLIDFYKNGQIRMVRQIGSMDDSLAVAQKRVFRDTIRVNVRDTVINRKNFVIDSLPFVPLMGAKFQMQAVVKKVSGVDVPLFEASVPFDVLLRGMDRQLIVNLKDAREKSNRFPGLKVGSTDQPNNNAGNWE